MKDLASEGMERMLDTDATPFERELLEAGALERPSPELLLTMQRGLGIEPGIEPGIGSGGDTSGPGAAPKVEPTLRGPTPSPAATGGASAWSSATLIKVGIGAALATGVVIAALSLPSRPAEPARANAARELVTAAPPEVPAPPVAPALSGAPAPAPDPARELRLEIELLDRARGALSAGEPERALSLLDEYAARFPSGTLAREAQVLRSKASRGTGRSRAKQPAASDPATLEAPTPAPARP